MIHQGNQTSDRPLLSLLVPTYNRANDLKRLLGVLIPIVQSTDDIDLLISNNGSSDDTATVMAGVVPHPRIRVIHQPIGYGVHIHIGWIYGQARGRFLWLIGDDDMVTPTLVARVRSILISSPDLAWIHLPHKFLSPSGSVHSPCPGEVVRCTRGRELFPTHFRWMTFVTANVIRTERIHACLPKLRLNHSYWPMTLLSMAAADLPAMILNECGVSAGLDISWKDEASEIGNLHLPQAIFESPVLSAAERRETLLHYYTECPDYLDRLAYLRPTLLLKILIACPRLFSLEFLGRLICKTIRRSFGKSKVGNS